MGDNTKGLKTAFDSKGNKPAASVGARNLPLMFLLLLPASPAWAYRPFVSTDAAVVAPQEMEVELGYFNLERTNRQNTFIVPKVILNYGLVRNLEIVGEFEVAKPPNEDAQLVDPGIFLKAVLKEGFLQEKEGIGFAVEAGPLLPSTVQGEQQVGFEGIGIMSGRLLPLTYHLNIGGGVDRTENNPFVIWGVIVELPFSPHIRLVGEVNGENTKGRPAANFGLVGFIWRPSSSSLFLDAGIRRGFSTGAPDWQFTMGLTFSVPIRPSP